MRVLVVDIGGTNIKVAGSWEPTVHTIPSGPELTAADLVEKVRTLARGWEIDAISIGVPAPVRHGRILHEPVNLGHGWVDFDFATAFGVPVRLINDAAMQALGSYEGGRMLFLGLGTGLGNAVVDEGRVEPLELAHLPYRNGKTYEEYLGKAGLLRLGRKKWEKHVHTVTDLLRRALICDYVVLGGGHVKKLDALPAHARAGNNANAITGGVRLWIDGAAGDAGYVRTSLQ